VVTTTHNSLGITPPVSTEIVRMWNRPFKVLWGDFPGALRAQIQDPAVMRIANHWPTGGPDQFRQLLWPRGCRNLLLPLVDPSS
jgi:hypothetical protein